MEVLLQVEDGICRKCKGTAFDRLQLKLSDFGLSKDLKKTNEESKEKQWAVGTSFTMAPETINKVRT